MAKRQRLPQKLAATEDQDRLAALVEKVRD